MGLERRADSLSPAAHRMITASAPGKIILFGEHAVVYGRPAIAVPVTQVQATVTIEPSDQPGCTIRSIDKNFVISLDLPLTTKWVKGRAGPNDPLAAIVRLTIDHLGLPLPDCSITVRSTIPIASGLGSGAAVSTAIVRALAKFIGQGNILPQTVSDLVYEVEKLHHGTPSGIDNTVIAFECPVYFIKGQPIQKFQVASPFTVVIGNTGVASPTKIAVGDVRKAWEADRDKYEALFDQIGNVAKEARETIESGSTLAPLRGAVQADQLGALLDRNQELLRQIDVSSPELEKLIDAAKSAGAFGAKLVGGGRGGNMIALVDDSNRDQVVAALKNAGAVSVIVTEIR
jgi:mevalonate kinase